MRLNKKAILRAAVFQKTKGGKRKLPRSPRPLPPDPVERQYARDMRDMCKKLKEICDRTLIAGLPTIQRQADNDSRPVQTKTDGYGSDIHDLVLGMRLQFEQAYTPAEIRRMASRAGMTTAEWNATQMNRSLSRVVDIPLFGGESWMGVTLEDFVIGNVNLIESIPAKYFSEVETLALQGVQQGTRWEDIAEKIGERFDVSESRANLIARDQVGKLNGQLNRLRQSEVGIPGYFWRGTGDSRERDSHKANNDKKFSWDDAPSETGHPGEDYQCRCWAEPDLTNLFADAEE